MFIRPSVCDLLLVCMLLDRLFRFVCYKFPLNVTRQFEFSVIYLLSLKKDSLYFYHKLIPKYLSWIIFTKWRLLSLVNCFVGKLALYYGLNPFQCTYSLNLNGDTINFTVCVRVLLYSNLRSTTRCLAVIYDHFQERSRTVMKGIHKDKMSHNLNRLHSSIPELFYGA